MRVSSLIFRTKITYIRNFWYATEIIVGERDNHRTYNGKAIERHFPLQRRTTKVILYVVNSTRFSEIMKPQCKYEYNLLYW